MKEEEKKVIVIPSSWIKNYDKDRKEIFKFREKMATKQAIVEDYDLDITITNDMGKIWHEVGGQDGMYDNFPIKRVYRDNNTVRAYAIDGGGGVAIIAGKDQLQIVTLGEDDGWHFLNSRRVYSTFYGSKTDFVYLISEALSLFNNINL